MRYSSNGNNLKAVLGVGIFLGVIIVLGTVLSFGTSIKNTEVAVIVNNVTGTVSTYSNGGIIFHLPLGLTSVYKIDKSQRVIQMIHGGKEGRNQICVKTNDGSNINMDVSLCFQIMASRANEVYRDLDDEENIEDILISLVRSEIRNNFGRLSTMEIAEASHRAPKLKMVEESLRTICEPLGLEIISILAMNFTFVSEYDQIVRERKEADQILANQGDFSLAAEQEKKRLEAEAKRDKETAISQIQGELAKQLVVAKGEAARVFTKAEQQAYEEARSGEIALQAAEQEAIALKIEGQTRADAANQLIAAYDKGGEALFREALTKFYSGVVISAKAYATSDRVDRLQYGTQSVLPPKPPLAPAK